MIQVIRAWWAKRRAIAAWRARHGVLPRYDPENGCRLFWRFEMKPATGTFDKDTGLPCGGWIVAYAKAWRRKPGLDQNDMMHHTPHYWIVREAGGEVELVKLGPPKRVPVLPPRPRSR